MGSYLSSPNQTKYSEDGGNSRILYGTCCMQGWRTGMEDAHSVVLDEDGTTFLGVFDGHGGKEVAVFCARHMWEEMKKSEAYMSGDIPAAIKYGFLRIDELLCTSAGRQELRLIFEEAKQQKSSSPSPPPSPPPSSSSSPPPSPPSLERSLLLETTESDSSTSDIEGEVVFLDSPPPSPKTFKQNSETPESTTSESATSTNLLPTTTPTPHEAPDKEQDLGRFAGCTSVVAVIRGNKLWVGNAGDSRAVLCRGGVAQPMSVDHKPNDQLELQRIQNAGGRVFDGRVNGNLNLSRAIGDLQYKRDKLLPPEKQMVTANPDVKEETLGDDDEFLILACDGIWDVKTSQIAVDFVRERLSKVDRLSQILEELLEDCLAPDFSTGLGCDNMTIVIAVFTETWKNKLGHDPQQHQTIGVCKI